MPTSGGSRGAGAGGQSAVGAAWSQLARVAPHQTAPEPPVRVPQPPLSRTSNRKEPEAAIEPKSYPASSCGALTGPSMASAPGLLRSHSIVGPTARLHRSTVCCVCVAQVANRSSRDGIGKISASGRALRAMPVRDSVYLKSFLNY